MGKIIGIKNISDGMTSAQAVLNRMGQVLIPAGVGLTLRHAELLKTWGVNTVEIKESDAEESSAYSEQILQLATERTRGRLLWTPESELEKSLFALAVESECRDIVAEQKRGGLP